ncbi:MAG: AsmA family protein [Desulfovibrio sp.]|nr:AsmA family protein [Desulfovibrio sp.]MBI4959062.1 AsmA family protein [Desulfovibrio sp.]
MRTPIKIAIFSAAGVCVLMAALVVLGLSLDPNAFKNQIAKTLKDTTGLDVAFFGPIKVTYFPSLGVELSQVAVNSPADVGGDVLAKLGKASVSVKVIPLLSGKVEAGKVSLDGLELGIVRDEKGNLNLPKSPVKEVTFEGEKVVIVTDKNERFAIDYQIEDVSITNSRFTFDDRMTKNKARVTEFNLNTGRVVRGKAFPVTLGFNYSLAEPEASGRVELSGQAMAIPEALRFAFENASLKTTASGKTLPVKSVEASYTGTIKVDVNNQVFSGEGLKLSATGKGGILPEAGAGFSLGMTIKTDLKQGVADITGLMLDVMGFALSGEVHAVNVHQAAQVNATLATNEFNPKQVLEKFGVAIQDSGTAKAQFKINTDMAKGTTDITDFSIKALGLDITSELHATDITGTASVKGKFALAECNPRQILARLGQPLPASSDASALTKLQLAYTFEGRGDTFSLRTETFKLDNTSMSLAMNMDKHQKPKINFVFKADSLDADRYIPAGGGEKQAPAKKDAAKPVDVAADVTGTVEIGKLKAAKLHMQNVSAKLAIKDNTLEVSPLQLSLYQGSLKASLRHSLRGGANAPLSASVNADGIQLEPLLTDMQGKAKLSGRASVNASVTATGQEAKEVLSSLNGKTSFALRNGAILGFDLSPDVFSSKEKLMAQGQGQARTNYESITGSFLISNGVASGNDLLAVVPPHKVTGQGWINLAAETLDYKVQASFAKLATIPVHLTGSLSSPNVSVDAAALATGVAKGVLDTVVKSPQGVINAPGNVGKGALDAVGNILGLPKKP